MPLYLKTLRLSGIAALLVGALAGLMKLAL